MKTVLDTRFHDLEQFMQEVQHWDLDFRAMDTGGFQGHLKQLVSENVLVSYARFQRGLDQAGATPLGFRTFAIPGKTCHGFWWRGHPVTNNDLLAFPPSNELQSFSRRDFEVITISLRESCLVQLVNDLGITMDPTGKREVIPLEPRAIQEIRKLAGMIVRATDAAAASAISQVLAERLLVSAYTGAADKRVSMRKRDLAVDRVTEYVRSAPAPASELAGLCRIAGVSERTLQYAFRERYGMPPNVYIRRWKLNTARRLLLQADPTEATVNDIAMDLGFHHQGQFAADYRKLFLETPSATLGSKH